MTIKEYYEMMKCNLRGWNKTHNWDGTPFAHDIEHHSKRAKTEFMKLLNKDFDKIMFDVSHGIITTEQYNQRLKVWNDCLTSIARMNIF